MGLCKRSILHGNMVLSDFLQVAKQGQCWRLDAPAITAVIHTSQACQQVAQPLNRLCLHSGSSSRLTGTELPSVQNKTAWDKRSSLTSTEMHAVQSENACLNTRPDRCKGAASKTARPFQQQVTGNASPCWYLRALEGSLTSLSRWRLKMVPSASLATQVS